MARGRRGNRTCLAVADIQAIRRALKAFLRVGGPNAKQRRRVRRTNSKLHGVRVKNGYIELPNRLVREVLWCLAQVPHFMSEERALLDEFLGGR